MALSQLKDARKILETTYKIKKSDDTHHEYQKKLNTSMRTIRFGIRLLERGTVDYHLTQVSDVSEEQVEKALEELRYAYMRSELPESPDVDAFGDLLYSIRIRNLEEENA
jgi:hypothetical protein